jgi:hypothetical protein
MLSFFGPFRSHQLYDVLAQHNTFTSPPGQAAPTKQSLNWSGPQWLGRKMRGSLVELVDVAAINH